jgi:hypothetical protein
MNQRRPPDLKIMTLPGGGQMATCIRCGAWCRGDDRLGWREYEYFCATHWCAS